MNAGRLSSAALMLSGVAAVVNPRGVADALHLTASDARGVTETRAGLGGTYAALGGWALVSREPAADVAVGMTWLGAAVVRVATRKIDRPPVTASYWAYLGLEVGCGTASLASAVMRRRAARRLRGSAALRGYAAARRLRGSARRSSWNKCMVRGGTTAM
jgi:hypothetical protein